MKKQNERKLSLKKLQLVKITDRLSSIKGGCAAGGGTGGVIDTIIDNTDGPSGNIPTRPKTTTM